MKFLAHALITVVLLLVLLGAVGYLLTRKGVSARAEPSRAEAYIARRLRSLAIPADAKQMTNPYAGKADAWRLEASHFQEHCAICHAPDGRGRSPIGQSLYPKSPDMTQPATQDLSDGELFYIIQNGVRFTGMPAWAAEHSADETWRLVSFIRHLPRLTPQELEQITKPAEPQVESAAKPSHSHAPGTKPHRH